MPILQTKNLTKRFDGVKAVDGLSMEIEKGKNIKNLPNLTIRAPF